MDFGQLSILTLLAAFVASAGVIGVCGTRMTDYADRLADRTGLGEAMVGGVLLGMATSLSGTIVSITAALDGRADLAFANGIGGIAAQTAFLAVADLYLRDANLERASAEQSNVFQASVLTLMLAFPVMAFAGPDVTILGMHPVSWLLPALYVGGVRATEKLRQEPMWKPVATREGREDTPDEPQTDTAGILPLAGRFALMAFFLALAGWTIAKSGGALSDRVGVSESAVGALLTAVITSLPELITTLQAVRRGALQLAVSGIVGGNTFDVLFLTLADGAYRDGSIYHAIGQGPIFWNAVGMGMTAILLLGLLFRHRGGSVGIGFESGSLLVLYAIAIVAQAWMG